MRARQAHLVVRDATRRARERMRLVARGHKAIVPAEARELRRLDGRRGEHRAGRDGLREVVPHREVGRVAGPRVGGRGGRCRLRVEDAAVRLLARGGDVEGGGAGREGGGGLRWRAGFDGGRVAVVAADDGDGGDGGRA